MRNRMGGSGAALLATLGYAAVWGLPHRAAAAGSADGDSSAEGGLQEIVVTATRREESLERVPISVTAFSQDVMDARGVRDVADIARLTPNLTFSRSSYFSSADTDISIRGIDSFVGAHTTGIYVDDTPIQVRGLGNSAANAYPEIFDLDRVEVLRGPQGTLFGAGAEGGAVRFITPQPSLTDSSGYARAELSETKSGAPSYEAGVAYGMPIETDVIGMRASAWYRRDGGWVDRASYPTGDVVAPNSNYQDSSAFKLAFAIAPTTSLRITPSVYLQNIYVNDTSGWWEGLSSPAQDRFKTGYVLQQPLHDRFELPAIAVDYDGGAWRLVSNTSYFSRHSTQLRDYTNFDTEGFGSFQPYVTIPGQNAPTYMTNNQSDFTQELRLQSNAPDARLQWVAGVFYSFNRQLATQLDIDHYIAQLIQNEWNGEFNVDTYFGAPMLPGDVFFTDTVHSDTWQTALFGQLDYDLTERLKATAGVRVADTGVSYDFAANGPLEGGFNHSAGSHSERPVTPKFGLSYQLDPHDLFYVTAAKGYRAGGAQNPQSPVACASDLKALGIGETPTSYDSDYTWSYEAGVKSALLGGRLVINSDVFLIHWHKIQQEIYLPSCGGLFIANEGTATARGAELEAQVKPLERLTLGVALGYTDAQYTQTVLEGQNAILVENGDHLGGPALTGTLSGEYDIPVAASRTLYGRFDFTHTNGGPGEDARTFGYDPELTPDPRTNYLTLRAGMRIEKLNVSLFANNATNQHPDLARYHLFYGSPLLTNVSFRPLTVGATAEYRF